MKTLMVGECSEKSTYHLSDPDAMSETEFEHAVVKALACAYPEYSCVLFGGTFRHEDSGARRPDLALVARNFSHWFIVEVELTSHSLEQHVLPQVRSFVYGDPQEDCSSILSDRLNISKSRAETLVRFVPRSVAIIANRRNEMWRQALRGLNAQMVVVSVFKTAAGGDAVELDGELLAVQRSLGFGIYSAVDRSVRFPASVCLPRGELEFVDEGGAAATWLVREGSGLLWATKRIGVPDLSDGAYAQVVGTFDGRILLRARSLGRAQS